MIISYFRTLFFSVTLIILLRLTGKRQIGQMAPSEFVVAMLMSNLASIPIQDGGIPLMAGLVPILSITGLELLLSGAALRSIRLRRLLCGNPVILMENGRILQKNLAATRITLDELSELLREKDVLDPKTVQYAILETNGALSVFLYPDEAPASAREAGISVKARHLPIPIVSDGRLLKDNLALAKKDRAWVDRVLKEHLCTLEDTWLLTVDRAGSIVFYKKEGL